MSALTEARVLQVLEVVKDPDMGTSIVSMGMIKDVKIDGDALSLTCELTTPACPVKEKIDLDIREAIAAHLPEILRLTLNMTARVRESHIPHNENAELMLPQIKHVILVGAGKGGVGKSTCAVNLALALRKSGATVALLDCDLYGPSIPIMTGLKEKPKLHGETKIMPMKALDIEIMSMGFLVDANQAMIWRGPVLEGIIIQFLRDVVWSPADYLVVDLPPGTGDVALSLARNCSVTGAVLVSTPQKVAMADVIRARTMFRQTKIAVLGLIENMSGYIDPASGERVNIFAGNSGEVSAAEMGVPFLGSIPLDPEVSASGDAGTPIVVSKPGSPAAKALYSAAEKLAAQISIQALTRGKAGAEMHSMI